MKREMWLPFGVLAAVPFIMVLGNSMLIPVFPAIEARLDLSQFQVGLLVTVFSVAAGLVIPFAGALSDRIGRKPVMVPALVLYGLGGLVAGFASLAFARPYGVILAGRILQGIGAGGTYQIALALTGDVFTTSERTKAVGLLEAANGLGKVVSPILGSLFALITWFAPFFVYGILSVPIAAAVWWLVKEPKHEAKHMSPKQYLHGLRKVFARKAGPLLSSYFAGMVGLFLLFGLLSYLSDELETRFQITGFLKGWVLALPVGTMAVTSYVTGTLLQHRHRLLVPAIAAGLGLAAVALALVPLGQALTPFLALTSAAGLGIGLILPPINTLVTGATDRNQRGLVTAFYGTVRFFGVAIGPPAFGLVQGGSEWAIFLGGAAIAASAAALALVFIRPEPMREGRQTGPSAQKDGPARDQLQPEGAPAGAHVRRNRDCDDGEHAGTRTEDPCSPF